jgi:hypothetical protein
MSPNLLPYLKQCGPKRKKHAHMIPSHLAEIITKTAF